MKTLADLIAAHAHHEEIAAYLDKLAPAGRLSETRTLDAEQQRVLFQLVARAAPITLDHFVPPHVGPLTEVIHHGKNTIPLPHALRRFEKRFCLPKPTAYDAYKPRRFGYNEGFSRKFIGPGYFVAESTEGSDFWRQIGGVMVDYLQVPNQEVVTGWPHVIPNERGLQRFVFAGTRDLMRKVSEHVSIGAAYRSQKALGFHFVLCRQPI